MKLNPSHFCLHFKVVITAHVIVAHSFMQIYMESFNSPK